MPGGYDAAGNLSTDPAAVKEANRVLPIGYWKGSGMSIALDMICSVLSQGNPVSRVGTLGDEIGLNQVMIAIDPAHFGDAETQEAIIEEILADLRTSEPVEVGGEVCYPGQRMLRTLRENREKGIPVVESIWQSVCQL